MDTEKLRHWAEPRLILAATNLADERAVACQAAWQARESGARVLLVHTLRDSSRQARLSPRPSSRIVGPPSAAAWEVLLRMARMIEWQGAACEPVLLKGEPAEQITELVQKQAVDRVIVATRSTRGLERVLAGSVAEALMSSVEVPVCVIGPSAVSYPFRGTLGGQILLTLSLSRDRSDCVDFAALLAVRRHSTLTMMHVVESEHMGHAERNVARGVAHASLVTLATRVKDPLARIEIAIREGVPARTILEEDPCPGWDFIVMGAPSHGMVSTLLGNSVVQRVIAMARCPVITLRPPARELESREVEEEAVPSREGELPVHAGAGL